MMHAIFCSFISEWKKKIYFFYYRLHNDLKLYIINIRLKSCFGTIINLHDAVRRIIHCSIKKLCLELQMHHGFSVFDTRETLDWKYFSNDYPSELFLNLNVSFNNTYFFFFFFELYTHHVYVSCKNCIAFLMKLIL